MGALLELNLAEKIDYIAFSCHEAISCTGSSASLEDIRMHIGGVFLRVPSG
jgi:hypothetical protein